MRAGALDQPIEVVGLTLTPDGTGGNVKSWSVLFADWAGVGSPRGREAENSDRVVATGDVVFTIHQRSDFGEKDKVRWNGVDYNIRHITPSRRPPYIDIHAERGVAQ